MTEQDNKPAPFFEWRRHGIEQGPVLNIPETRWTGKIIIHIGRWAHAATHEPLHGISAAVIHPHGRRGLQAGIWAGIWTREIGAHTHSIWGLE